MTRDRSSLGSGLKLVAFFSLILIPVVLVLGPLRETFYPPAAAQAAALADLTPPDFDQFALGDGDEAWRATRASLRDAYERGQPAVVTALLERLADVPSPQGVLLLEGVCYLLQRRPGPALIRLQQIQQPSRERHAAWYTAQCHLILGQPRDARSVLVALTSADDPVAARARRQLQELDELLSHRKEGTP